MVVSGVQCGRRGRWNPGSVRTGLRMPDFRFQHAGHQVRHGPHALTNLGNATETGFQADVHVPLLVGIDPGRLLHRTLADKRTQLHGGMDLIPGAIQETGVNKHSPLFRGVDTGFQVNCGATLLVHDADLQAEARQAQCILYTTEKFVGECHLFRPVHLRLHDIHGAFGAVLELAIALHVVNGDQ